MKPAHRRQVIANFLEEYGPMGLRDLCARTSIDQNTLGADLNQMEMKGKVARTEVENWRGRNKVKVSRFVWRLVA